MTNLTININLDNEAFDYGQVELARILRELSVLAENNALNDKTIRDINGNKVGSVEFSK